MLITPPGPRIPCKAPIAKDYAGKKRRGDHQDQKQTVATAMARDEIGNGPGKNQADDRGCERANKGTPQKDSVGGLGQQHTVIVEIPVRIELVAFGPPEAEHNDRNAAAEEALWPERGRPEQLEDRMD